MFRGAGGRWQAEKLGDCADLGNYTDLKYVE